VPKYKTVQTVLHIQHSKTYNSAASAVKGQTKRKQGLHWRAHKHTNNQPNGHFPGHPHLQRCPKVQVYSGVHWSGNT